MEIKLKQPNENRPSDAMYQLHTGTVLLNPGRHSFTVHYQNNAGEAAPVTVTVPYDYRAEQEEIILPGPRYSGPKAAWIEPAGSDSAQQMLEQCLQDVKQAAEEKGLCVSVRINMKFTDEQKEMKLVYRNKAFYEDYVPGKHYEKTDVIVPLTSIDFAVEQWEAGQPFFNVIGSTADPKIKGKNWLPLWREHITGYAETCYADPTSTYSRPCTGNNNLKGGHVVKENPNERASPPDSEVYILPICGAHNCHLNYNCMITQAPVQVLRLIGYFR